MGDGRSDLLGGGVGATGCGAVDKKRFHPSTIGCDGPCSQCALSLLCMCRCARVGVGLGRENKEEEKVCGYILFTSSDIAMSPKQTQRKANVYIRTRKRKLTIG